MSGLIDRTDSLPQLFEVAALDILDANEQVLARLNVYIHALSAVSPNPRATSCG